MKEEKKCCCGGENIATDGACATDNKESKCSEHDEDACHCGLDVQEGLDDIKTKGKSDCGCAKHGSENKKNCGCNHKKQEKEIIGSCCSVSKKVETACGCGVSHVELNNKKQNIQTGIKLCISLIFLVMGFFNWHSISMGTPWLTIFYYVNPAWLTVILCGIPIFIAAIKSLANKKITASVLISTAMIASLALEIVGFFIDLSAGGDSHQHSYVFAAGEVAFLMALGGIIEDLTIRKSRSGIERLVNLIPKVANVFIGDEIVQVNLSDIKIGDIVVVKAGEKIAVDGVVISGNSLVDQSSVTGEYVPKEINTGDYVFGGTFNTNGVLHIKVDKLLKDMTIAKMVDLVEEAEGKKAPISKIADKWASYIVPAAIIISFLVGIIANFAFKIGAVSSVVRAITILIVFCPCSLALATPTAIAAGLGNSAKNGVLIKSGESLEALSGVDTICFDKTGTLTQGNISVDSVFAVGMEESQLLAIAASVEVFSEHPLAKAIVDKAVNVNLKATNVEAMQGIGVKGMLDGKEIVIISYDKAKAYDIDVAAVSDNVTIAMEQGKTVVVVVIDGVVKGCISFSDTVKEGVADFIANLNKRGYRTVMLTGDNQQSAEFIAKQCYITEFHHSLMPEDKLSIIEKIQKDGHKICMVGDGINDAPALKVANVGIAMGALGSDIAIETADMAIMNNDITKVDGVLRLSKRTLNTIKRNIVISMGINVLAIIASSMAWLTPVTGALVHNLTSIFVVLSSSLLLINRKVIGKVKLRVNK